MRRVVRLISILSIVFSAVIADTSSAWAAPGPVTNVQASDGTYADRIRIAWNNADYGFRHYVYRSTSSSDRCAGGYIANPLSTTNYFDDFPTADGQNPSAGVRYYYTVKALDVLGVAGPCSSSPGSGWRSPPNGPGNVDASDGDYADKIRITWSHPPTGAPISYKLYVSSSSGACTDSSPLTLSGTTTSIDQLSVTPGQLMYYSLKAEGPLGYGNCSSVNSGHVGMTISGDLGTTLATVGVTGIPGVSSCSVSGSSYSCKPVRRNTTVTITPSKNAWTFSPASQTFSNITSNQVFNFTANGSEPNPPRNVDASWGTSATSITITWTAPASGGGPFSSYRLYRSTSATAAPCSNLIETNITGTSYTDTENLSVGTPYYYSMAANGPGGTSACSNVDSGIAGTAPSITNQPDNQSVLEGQTATFSVQASGTTPRSYQWYKNGSLINGATSSSYTTPAAQLGDSGSQFHVVVSNAIGNRTSNPATLTVTSNIVPPTITGHPQSQTVVEGGAGIFSVSANGTQPLNYAWYKNGSLVASGPSSSYVTPPASLSDNGAQFYVIVSNSAGNATSNSATLTVLSAAVAPAITSQPANASVLEGQSASFTVGASGTAPLSYQWSKNGVPITGATGASYVTPPTTLQDNGALYTVRVTNSAGFADSGAAMLTVQSATFTVSGNVALSGGAGLGGVLVSDGTRSAQTDANGNYVIANVPSGTYNLVASRLGYIITPNAGTNPVNVAGATVSGKNFTASCAPGFALSGNQCVPADGTPIPPQNLSASDGTSTEEVVITWDISPNATGYIVYRSEFSGDRGIALSTAIPNTLYRDKSAIPGVKYFYSATAANSAGESGLSNQDDGFRADADSPCFNQGGDSDGDGVCDDQEEIDGTDPNDRGSFQLHLKSPAFTKYNTFLNQLDFLELIANGTKDLSVTVTVYDINGKILDSSVVQLQKSNQVDLDIHSIVGPDTYGVIKIEWKEAPGATLGGRMSNYRLNPDQETYSFAFAKELRNPTRGRTYATGNAFDPMGLGFLVPNWAEIVNLDNKTRTFTYNLYDQEGKVITSTMVSVPAFGERDLQAGHENGEGAYLSEFIPHDGATKYFATVSRYSSNAPGGQIPDTYNFAFPLDARAGNGEKQFAPISNLVGGCWSQTNWFEVVNVREKPVTATLVFRDGAAGKIESTTASFEPMTQYHFNASALLEKAERGSVEIKASDPGSIIAQSAVYFHDCAANLLQSAYASQARIPGQDVQAGTFNTFLGIKNILTLIGTTDEEIELTLEVRSLGELLSQQTHALNSFRALDFDVSNEALFGTEPDTYGTIILRTEEPKQVLGENLRLREINGKVDFAMPTVVQ